MKRLPIIKRVLAVCLIFLLSINSFAAIVSDNDGSAFVTKAEFDALKNSFAKQIDDYNSSIEGKIDGAIASYLNGIKLSTFMSCDLPTSQTIFKTFDEVNFPFVPGSHDLIYFNNGICDPNQLNRTGPSWFAFQDTAKSITMLPDKTAKAIFINGDNTHPILVGYASNWNYFAKTLSYNAKTYCHNSSVSSNVNRYGQIRMINNGVNGGGEGVGNPHDWLRGNNYNDKKNHIVDFTDANAPYMGTTTNDPDNYREACTQLWPFSSEPWDMTAYDTSDRLVSITTVETPKNCISLTGKPNRIEYRFFDIYNTNTTTRNNEINKLWDAMQKYVFDFRVVGWGNYGDATTKKHKRGDAVDLRVTINDKSQIIPTWTDDEAATYKYGMYLPFIAYDNKYLADTTKLWTAEYDSIASETEFKNFVGSGNTWYNASDGKTYYNLSSGLVLMNEEKNGLVTMVVKNTGVNDVLFYVLRSHMDVNSGYDINKVIITDKSNSTYKNGVLISAGATETIKFTKEQKYILFNFQAVNSSKTKINGGSISIDEIMLQFED